MLIASDRHTEEDLRVWASFAGYDETLGASDRMRRLEDRALEAIADFGRCHVGVSWGKDSVVVAHLARRIDSSIPLVWVREEPFRNPDCAAVRDAFLVRCPGHYDEIEAWGRQGDDGVWHATGSIEAGFDEAARRYGARYISGIRAEESAIRKLRVARWGTTSPNTCAPIARWSGVEVFAYLAHHDLPIHPAYAMSFDGALERTRLRVSSLGFRKGRGRGRHEWERHYYRDAMVALGLEREYGL